jgi:HEAT repeat protein
MLMRRDGVRFRHADAMEEAAGPADESAIRDLDSPDLLVQVDAAYRIRLGRDPRAAAAVAQRAATTDAPHRLLLVRIVTEFGDERSIPALTTIAKRGLNTEIGQQAASALFFIVGRSILESYWFVPDAARARLESVRPQLDRETFRAWLRNPRVDNRLRYVAAWGAGILNDQEVVPYLLKLQERDFDLGMVATIALTRMGRAREAVDLLVAGLDQDDTYLPSLLIELYRVEPDAVRPAIRDGLVGGTAKQRETLAYVTAVLRDPELAETLADLREDSSPRVRSAAAWALESLEEGGPGQRSEDPRREPVRVVDLAGS